VGGGWLDGSGPQVIAGVAEIVWPVSTLPIVARRWAATAAVFLLQFVNPLRLATLSQMTMREQGGQSGSAPAMTTSQIAALVGAELRGPGDIVITGPCTLALAGPGSLTFIRDQAFVARWAGSKASAALISAGMSIPEPGPGRALLVVGDADLALIKVLERFAPAPPAAPAGVHATAIVDESAAVAATAHVGPQCIIGAGVHIGAGAVLYAGAIIGEHVRIGEGTILHPRVTVMERCIIGRRCTLHPGVVIGADGFGYRPSPDGRGVLKIPHTGNVEIHDDVEIGANTCVDRGKFGPTVIGAGTKIDNLVQVAHNVTIGRACLIAGGVGIAGSTSIGDGVIIGGQAGLKDNIEIGAGARIAAMSAIMSDVAPKATMVGAPAVGHIEFFRRIAALKKLTNR